MCSSYELAYAALALACLSGTVSAAEPPGRKIFVNNCQACHGGTAPAELESLLDYLGSLR